MAKSKTYTPTGKSRIRLAILKILQTGEKALTLDDKNVTKANINKHIDKFGKSFTVKQLESGAKFVRQIRDKTVVDGMKVFAKGETKTKALTYFADQLDKEQKAEAAKRSTPEYKFNTKAAAAINKAARTTKGNVMYSPPEIFVVEIQDGAGGKKKIYGGYASATAARSAARTYISGIKKAFDPLVSAYYTTQTKTGRASYRQAKLKITSRLYTSTADGKAKAGEATYKFDAVAGSSSAKAIENLRNNTGFKPPIVRVIKLRDKKEHKGYWKLFTSPAIGKIRLNPKR